MPLVEDALDKKLNKRDLEKIATTIRSLTMDCVEKAKSGHPGLPMGCAELGAFLFAELRRVFQKILPHVFMHKDGISILVLMG